MVPPTPLALSIQPLSFLKRLVFLGLIPVALEGQATQTVPPNDPVYAFIDRLVAARLVDGVILGQRPMSRREIGRIVAAALNRSPRPSWLSEHIDEYAAAFPDSLAKAPVTSLVEADAIAMESPSRGIISDGSGSIDVNFNPMSSNQLGRPIANGLTLSHTASIGAGVTRWLAVAATERMTWLDDRGRPAESVRRIDQLYARAVWKNAALSIGRDYLYLGQGETAGLIASLNAPSVNMARLGSDRPFNWPWLLRYIGPTQAVLEIGDLGPNQRYPHTRFVAYKISSRPHPRFEIGVGLAEQVGGEGSPPGTFVEKVEDAFPLLDAVILHRRSLFSNKFVAVDIRYALPGIPGTQFYAEGAFDDFDLRRVRSTFTEDAGYVWGLSSCFSQCGPVRASVEYHVTGLRYYTHTLFNDGFTVDRTLIGDQLGPRGRGAYTSIELNRGSMVLGLHGAYENRNGNLYYAITTTPDDSDFRFAILAHRPAERRWRLTPTVSLGSPSDRVTYLIRGGAERVENFDHVHGAWRTNWLLQTGIQVRPTLPFH